MLDDYRPISILPAISKTFEVILYDQLYSSKCQIGFRQYHSTSAALLDGSNQWYRYSNMDRRLINIIAFTDRKKAFDIID